MKKKTLETRAMEAFIVQYVESAFDRRPRNHEEFQFNSSRWRGGEPIETRASHEWSTDRIACYRVSTVWIVADGEREVDVHEVQIQRQPDEDGKNPVVLRFLCQDADDCVDLWDAAVELTRLYRESDRLNAAADADANNLQFRTTDMEG